MNLSGFKAGLIVPQASIDVGSHHGSCMNAKELAWCWQEALQCLQHLALAGPVTIAAM